MRKMKNYVMMLCAVLAMGAVVASCSSDEEAVQGAAEGKGLVKLSLNVGADFQSRAITESDYTNLANYTVQILKEGKVVEGCEWTGTTIPQELIELDNGSYTVLAFTGEGYKGVGATTEGMYVEGSAGFSVNSDQTATAEVNCAPQCARATVNFDAAMADYFQDYYVVFSGTEALGQSSYTWAKDHGADPVYMAVDGTETLTATIKLVDKTGKVAEDIVRTKQVSAAKAWKLKIAPVVEEATGSVGITVEIDNSTNDIEVDIEIPSEWL